MGAYEIPWAYKPPLGTPLRKGHWSTDDLIAHWGFLEGGGDKAFDGIGDNPGTLAGTAPGWKSGSLYLPGADEYVQIGNLSLFEGLQQLSVSAWVYHDSIDSDDSIVGNWDQTDGFVLWRDDAAFTSGRTDTYSIAVEVGEGGDARIEGATGASPQRKWTQVGFTFIGGSATGLRLYVDGIEDANSPADTSGVANTGDSTDALRIGENENFGWPFDGLFDQVSIYKRALSDSEMLQLYEQQYVVYQPQLIPFMAGVMAAHYYRTLLQGDRL